MDLLLGVSGLLVGLLMVWIGILMIYFVVVGLVMVVLLLGWWLKKWFLVSELEVSVSG